MSPLFFSSQQSALTLRPWPSVTLFFYPLKGPQGNTSSGGSRERRGEEALDGKTAGRRQGGGLDASIENARPIRGGMERGRRAPALSGLRETGKQRWQAEVKWERDGDCQEDSWQFATVNVVMLPESLRNTVIITVEGIVGARDGSEVHALMVTVGNNGRGSRSQMGDDVWLG